MICQVNNQSNDSKSVVKINPHLMDYEITILHQLKDLPLEWDILATPQNYFLTSSYLSILSDIPDQPFDCYYVLFKQGSQLQGIAYFQKHDFSFRESVNYLKKEHPAWSALKKRWLRMFARFGDWLEFKLLVCGSLFLTGEHGFLFAPTMEVNLQYQLLLKAFDQIIAQGVNANLIFVKDLLAKRPKAESFFTSNQFSNIPFQPSMELTLKKDWISFDHYLAAMTSKYRVRAKRAFKKGKELKFVELNLTMVKDFNQQLYQLYLNIAHNVGFNIATLPINYFHDFKRQFPDRFRVFGYFNQNKLIGFCTTFLNHQTLEAHFLGFTAAANTQFQLYLNMLYQMIKVGIESQVDQIHFARTALEIKSSVGAIPHSYNSYLKHTGPRLNQWIPWISNTFEPKVEWTQRKPFKQL